MKKYQLPKEFAERWIAALRSGEYQQDTDHGMYYVPQADCYCAMGAGLRANGFTFKSGGELVDGVDIFEISNGGGSEMSPLWHEIMRMNDTKRLSFTEIADWLEQNVEFI